MTRKKRPAGIDRNRFEKRSASRARWVLQDPETLDLAFQTFEDLTALRQHCARKLAKARETEHLFGPLLLKDDESGLRRWSRLSDRVTIIWRLLDHTVRDSRLDLDEFQAAYRGMLAVRMAWTRLETQPGPISLIDQIIQQLRQLLICYAQAHGHGRRAQP